MPDTNKLRVSLAQISPQWLNRAATLDKVQEYIRQAAGQGSQLLAFGEALVPGYPFWPELTNGAQFESSLQKDLFAYYSEQAVDIDAGDLQMLCKTARQHSIAVYLGCIERAADRGGQSLYASLVYITADGRWVPFTVNFARPMKNGWSGRRVTVLACGCMICTVSGWVGSIAGKTGCRYRGPHCTRRAKMYTWRYGPGTSGTRRILPASSRVNPVPTCFRYQA